MDFSDVNWGSSTQAQTYKTALSSVLKLSSINEHVKNYRPQILVLSGKPCARPPLLDMAYLITKNNALLICGEIVEVCRHKWRIKKLDFNIWEKTEIVQLPLFGYYKNTRQNPKIFALQSKFLKFYFRKKFPTNLDNEK